MTPQVELDELVTAADIGRRLGVSRQRAHQLTAISTFPKPLGEVAGSAVWRWAAIENWSARRDRRAWIDRALALVPRGSIVQSQFKMALNAYLENALGSKPETPGAAVADVVRAAMTDLGGVPKFDPQLLELEWPS